MADHSLKEIGVTMKTTDLPKVTNKLYRIN